MLALAGCRLEVEVATSVAADGSGAVVVTVRADEELVAAVPGLLADLRLGDLGAAGWAVEGPSTGADGVTALVLSKPFSSPEQATEVLAEVGAPLQADVAQVHDFAEVRTTVEGSVTGVELSAFADAELVQALGGVPLADRVTTEQLATGFGMTVRFTLPGEVVSTNGTVEEGVIAWQPAMAPGSLTPLEADAELRDDDALAARDREAWARRGLGLWLGFVVLVAVVGGVVWWLLRHRRRRANAR